EKLEKKLNPPEQRSSTKLLWPFNKPKMEHYLGLLEEQRSKLRLLLATATAYVIRSSIPRGSGFSSSFSLFRQKEFRKVLKWLNVVDPGANYSYALSVRQPGTGNWLLEGPEYIDWKEGRGGVLWLYGIPGCGKSVLSATAIEDAKNVCNTNDDHALAYFYFTFSDSEKQNLLNMLLSILGQLLEGISDRILPDEVLNLYHSSEAIGKSVDIKALKSALLQVIRISKRTFIVLDALDEFPKDTRESLLSWITELTVDHNKGALSILVTSRPEADIVKSIEPLATFPIPLQSKTIDPDIRAYSEIEERLVARSQGMFRWVYCLLRVLQECITPEDVREALEELPEDLDSVYLRILDSIPKRQKEYIRRAMNWLAFSVEPLTLGQLAEAIVIKYDVNKYGHDSKTLFEQSSLLSICPSLISFEDARAGESSPQEDRRLRLAHFSVKEYLVSDRAAQGPSAYCHISDDKANLLMGHACLSRILRHSAPGTISGKRVEKKSFLYHSARYWFVYTRSIEDPAPAPLSDAVVKVLELGKEWLDIYNPDDLYSPDPEPYPPAIYYSSLLNLVTACEFLVNRKADTVNVNAQGGRYGNALQAAAIQGNESVVRFLLERGAEVNARGGYNGNALQAAAIRGNESVV
ncbi:unnamed protein product, partial [Tuber aestivum]